jgi:hypothetical protein
MCRQYLVTLFAVGVACFASPTTFAADSLLAAPSQPPQATVDLSSLADKTAVMTGQWVNSPRGPVFGMDVLLGMQMGIRPSVGLYTSENSSFVVEGYYGGLFTKFGSSEGAGAGVRWITSRGGPDAVTIGPGVDVLFNFNRGQAAFLAPTVDIAWRHSFGNRAGLVLGLNAGLGIGLTGKSGNDDGDQVSGRLTPLISLFAGLRY